MEHSCYIYQSYHAPVAFIFTLSPCKNFIRIVLIQYDSIGLERSGMVEYTWVFETSSLRSMYNVIDELHVCALICTERYATDDEGFVHFICRKNWKGIFLSTLTDTKNEQYYRLCYRPRYNDWSISEPDTLDWLHRYVQLRYSNHLKSIFKHDDMLYSIENELRELESYFKQCRVIQINMKPFHSIFKDDIFDSIFCMCISMIKTRPAIRYSAVGGAPGFRKGSIERLCSTDA